MSLSGGDRVLAILGAGTIVGELSMFDGKPRSASVTAIRSSRLSFVTRANFNAMLDAHPDIYRELTIMLAGRLRAIDEAMAATSFLSLRGRAARVLLTLADAFGQKADGRGIVIRQRITQSDIAAMAGITREGVNRVMHDWLSRAIVSRLAEYYCLENKSVLEHECDF
jgi:CRP-like cAMP-binding protein